MDYDLLRLSVRFITWVCDVLFEVAQRMRLRSALVDAASHQGNTWLEDSYCMPLGDASR